MGLFMTKKQKAEKEAERLRLLEIEERKQRQMAMAKEIQQRKLKELEQEDKDREKKLKQVLKNINDDSLFETKFKTKEMDIDKTCEAEASTYSNYCIITKDYFIDAWLTVAKAFLYDSNIRESSSFEISRINDFVRHKMSKGFARYGFEYYVNPYLSRPDTEKSFLNRYDISKSHELQDCYKVSKDGGFIWRYFLFRPFLPNHTTDAKEYRAVLNWYCSEYYGCSLDKFDSTFSFNTALMLLTDINAHGLDFSLMTYSIKENELRKLLRYRLIEKPIEIEKYEKLSKYEQMVLLYSVKDKLKYCPFTLSIDKDRLYKDITNIGNKFIKDILKKTDGDFHCIIKDRGLGTKFDNEYDVIDKYTNSVLRPVYYINSKGDPVVLDVFNRAYKRDEDGPYLIKKPSEYEFNGLVTFNALNSFLGDKMIGFSRCNQNEHLYYITKAVRQNLRIEDYISYSKVLSNWMDVYLSKNINNIKDNLPNYDNTNEEFDEYSIDFH